MVIKNKLYGVLVVKRIKTLLVNKGLNASGGEYVYEILKRDYKNLAYEDFLNEVAKTKDMSVYAQYFYDTLDLEPYDFSKYVANTHDAKFCSLFYCLEDSNRELLFDEIVTSLDGEVCYDFLLEYDFLLDDSQKERLKLSLIDSRNVKVLKKCLKMQDFFTDEQRDLAEFSFMANATPKNVREYIKAESKENDMYM